MKKIYIILSNSGTRISKFFHFFTRAKYTHVSICLNPQFNTFYSFARRNIKLPIFAGIVKEHPNEGIFGIYSADCEIYELEVTDEQYDEIRSEIGYMLSLPKIHTYNFLGCPFIWLGIPIKRKHHFTCTQFVAYILQKYNVGKPEIPWELAQPQHFKNIGNKIFEGKVNDIKINC